MEEVITVKRGAVRPSKSVVVAALTGVVLLAGASFDAAAAGSNGSLYFQTGKTLSNFHFVYEDQDGVEQEPKQEFSLLKGCTVELDGADPAYVSLKALGPKGGADLGHIATSIGVYDGPQGTACGRVSRAKSEALELTLGDPALLGNANAFDRLELDLEVKGDVVLRLDVAFEESIVSYYLTAGAGQVVGEYDPDRLFECNRSSDSGADAGPADNCRWEVDALGRSFTITPELGEFSFEGGGDYPDAASRLSNRTRIYLTEIDGILDCGDPASTNNDDMSCSITRLDPGLGTCTPVPYVFRTGVDEGSSYCELQVNPGSQQFVANLFVTYEPESPPAGTMLDPPPTGDGNWPTVKLSKVSFADAPGVAFNIPACLGTTIDDAAGPKPIPEIAAGGFDRITTNGNIIDFACAFQRNEIFETNGDSLELQIFEGIQFWGDIRFSRD